LGVRWQICAQTKRWEECVEIAGQLVTAAPASAFGWIHRSFALHELKRTKEALEKLVPAADYFPEDVTIRYNLACYECVLGNLSRAKIRLAETFKLALSQKCFDPWRLQALGDPDLQALRGFVEEIEN